MACGSLSGGVEVIDIDAKNDPQLFDKLQKALNEFGVTLTDDVVYQTTINGGMHIIYKTAKSEGNQVLARAEDGKTLIETRGEGGYVVIAPSPGYQLRQGNLSAIPFIEDSDRETLFAACRSINEKFDEVKPKHNPPSAGGGLTPWEDFDQRGEITDMLELAGWKYSHKVGDNLHFVRPGKEAGTSATWHEGKRMFYVFTSSTQFEPSKAYTASAVFAYLQTGKDFSEAARELRKMGYGHSSEDGKKQPQPDTQPKHFKSYIIREEPVDEVGILSLGGVNVLNTGNVLGITGPPKSRKTGLAKVLVNKIGLKTAYLDTEQGRRHSWRLGKAMPLADVFHLRGQDQKELTRVLNECVNCGEYGLIVIDNGRDLLIDFNNVEEANAFETLLKRTSEKVPMIVLLHENKSSSRAQGHSGYSLEKIAQTVMRVSLADTTDPGKGSFVDCVWSRDEPFRQLFLSAEGNLSSEGMLRIGGSSMSQDEFFRALGDSEYSHDEVLDKIGEIFGIVKSTARNALTTIRRVCPDAILTRKEGKRVFYYVSPTLK